LEIEPNPEIVTGIQNNYELVVVFPEKIYTFEFRPFAALRITHLN
jgi:hypothetical protein